MPLSGAESSRHDLPARSGDIWHGALSPSRARPGTRYAFCVDGPNEPEKGNRFDRSVYLIDPFARVSCPRRFRCGLV